MWQGHLGGQAVPLCGRPMGPSGPKASCHVPLLHMSIFVTFLAKLWYVSCIQIILQAQVELGELLIKFYTSDDDLRHFTMLLGKILMVKMGVSNRQ